MNQYEIEKLQAELAAAKEEIRFIKEEEFPRRLKKVTDALKSKHSQEIEAMTSALKVKDAELDKIIKFANSGYDKINRKECTSALAGEGGGFIYEAAERLLFIRNSAKSALDTIPDTKTEQSLKKSAWSELQRIRAKFIGSYGVSKLDEILFGWFVAECMTTSYSDAGIHHILHTPEQLALLVLAEAERQLEESKDKFHGAGQGKWTDFVHTVGRSPFGVQMMERNIKVWSPEKRKEELESKKWIGENE